MNKRFLLPIFFILSSSLLNGITSEIHWTLNTHTAEYLINSALYSKMCAYEAKQKADAGDGDRTHADKEKQRADEAEKDLIKFGHQAQAAHKNELPFSVAGRISAIELLKQLKTKYIEVTKEKSVARNNEIKSNRQMAIQESYKAIENYEAADNILLANVPDTDIETAEEHKQRAAVAEDRAKYFNDNIIELEKELAGYESMLTELTKQLDCTINNLDSAQTSSEATFTQSVRTIITNTWTKRVACLLVTCGICKFMYNRYNQSNGSNDGENDDE